MQAMVHIGVRPQNAQPGDKPLDPPEHKPGLRFKKLAGIRQRAVDAGRSEREQQRRGVSRFDHGGCCAMGLFLLIAYPRSKRIHIAVAGQVCRDYPQACFPRGMRTVYLFSPLDETGVKRIAGCNNGSAACKQLGSHLACDRLFGCAGNYSNITGERERAGIFLCRRYCTQSLPGYTAECFRMACSLSPVQPGLLCIPCCLAGHSLPCTRIAFRSALFIIAVIDMRKVFACTGPAVVQKDSFARIEPRGNEFRPLRAKLGVDHINDSAVILGFLSRS